MSMLKIDALTENLDQVLAFIDKEMEGCEYKFKDKMQIDVAVEEIFVNVANYAYGPDTGSVSIEVMIGGEPKPNEITIIFRDRGIPYNPLARPDPDTTLTIEERQIGGLGIYMVKKSMDAVEYSYNDGMNCLMIKKKF